MAGRRPAWNEAGPKEMVIASGLLCDEDGPNGRTWEVRHSVDALEDDGEADKLYIGIQNGPEL